MGAVSMAYMPLHKLLMYYYMCIIPNCRCNTHKGEHIPQVAFERPQSIRRMAIDDFHDYTEQKNNSYQDMR